MKIDLRRARPNEAAMLTDLSMRSNGYDDAFMEACREELTVTAARMAEGEYWVAEADAVCGYVCLAVEPLEHVPIILNQPAPPPDHHRAPSHWVVGRGCGPAPTSLGQETPQMTQCEEGQGSSTPSSSILHGSGEALVERFGKRSSSGPKPWG